MSNIFITGASSYLGLSVINTFKEHSFIGLENKNKLPILPNLKSVKINKNSELPDILNNNNIEAVLHFATNSLRGNDESNKHQIFKVNYELGEALLISSIDLNIKKFITTGTYSQNIFNILPNYYVETKKLFQQLLIRNAEQNTDIINLHLGDVYGPYDFRNKLIPYLLKNENQSSINFLSNGLGPFSPVHINDVLFEIKKALNDKNLKGSYVETLIATKVRTVKTFISQYKEIRGKTFIPLYEEELYNPYQDYLELDKDKLVFNIDIKEGLNTI